jgi:hypothetical protein
VSREQTRTRSDFEHPSTTELACVTNDGVEQVVVQQEVLTVPLPRRSTRGRQGGS